MTEKKSIELFITEKESMVLEAIVLGDTPHSQRAQAILAADAGSTSEQAAEVAHLRVTQVRFWLGRFRNSRLKIFPESLIEEIEALHKTKLKKEAAKTDMKAKKAEKKKLKTEAKKKEEQKKKKKKSAKKKADVTETSKAKKVKKAKKAGKSKKEKKLKKKKSAKK